MASFYTGGGDWGETGLADGSRVAKDHPAVELLGGLDELNAQIGVARALLDASSRSVADALARIQDQLFLVGAEVALPSSDLSSLSTMGGLDLVEMEREIDGLGRPFAGLDRFVVPAGHVAAAQLQLARAVARRAERAAVTLAAQQPLRHELLAYLNRLSSLLFVLALRVNWGQGWAERAPRYGPTASEPTGAGSS